MRCVLWLMSLYSSFFSLGDWIELKKIIDSILFPLIIGQRWPGPDCPALVQVPNHRDFATRADVDSVCRRCICRAALINIGRKTILYLVMEPHWLQVTFPQAKGFAQWFSWNFAWAIPFSGYRDKKGANRLSFDPGLVHYHPCPVQGWAFAQVHDCGGEEQWAFGATEALSFLPFRQFWPEDLGAVGHGFHMFPWFDMLEGGESFEAAVATEEVCPWCSPEIWVEQATSATFPQSQGSQPPSCRNSAGDVLSRCPMAMAAMDISMLLKFIKYPKLDNFEPNTQVGIIWMPCLWVYRCWVYGDKSICQLWHSIPFAR